MFLGIALLIISIIYNDLLATSFVSNLEFLLFNLIPYLFILILVGNIFLNYLNFNKPFNYLNKIFNISYVDSLKIIMLSPILGNIASIKLINNLYVEEKIDYNETRYLLKFNIYMNPLFIVKIFKSYSSIIIISSIISNYIIHFFEKKKHLKIYQETKINKNSITNILTNSINMFVDSFFVVIIYIFLFTFLINILDPYIENCLFKTVLFSFIEITNIKNLTITSSLTLAISSFLLTFNGLSIMLQAKSIINKKISIKEILKYRLIAGALSFLITLGGSYFVL